MTDLTGQTIKGYEIREIIGQGNFGAVYNAFQQSIAREVALKVILPNYANRPDFIRQFETEAQLVARLEHPHIVPLFDYWREPDSAYIVMRLLPTSIRAELRENGRFDPASTVRIIEQMCSALNLFHLQNIVHRDIKPDNMLLDFNHNVYVSDFGLAKFLSDETDNEEGIAGSPAYMSPEQIRGEDLTPRSDIYAVGIIIYEMLTGSHPFAGLKLSSVITKQLREPLPQISVQLLPLPGAVNDVIQRATAKDPAHRYKSVLELAAALRDALLGTGETVFETIDMPSIADIPNPYKGLRPFEETDAADFYGREALVGQIVERLNQDHPMAGFLAIVGPSGSGKSSAIKAGLIPALRQGSIVGSDRWYIASMMPGTRPFDDLAAALLSVARKHIPDLALRLRTSKNGLVEAVNEILRGEQAELLLFIDQFEELFTLVNDEEARAHFMDLLINATASPDSRIRTIITLRADFYDRPLLYEDFGRLIQARTQVVLPLSTKELERAIMNPAERVGIAVDTNLTTTLISDVKEEPGALPLLQYTLTEIFERREGMSMTLNAYRDLGGVAGALARRAELVFSALSDQQQSIARQLFLRLVTLGEGTEDVRRRALRSELISIARDHRLLQAILDLFGKHRLLSFDHEPQTREPTVEIAHEALIRAWQRLRVWIAESRADVRQQRRLNELAEEWVKASRETSFLLTGLQLQQFEEWSHFTSLALTEEEQEFLEASIDERERRSELEAQRVERQAQLEERARRFRQVLLVVISVAFVVSLVFAIIAYSQREEAQEASDRAEQNAFNAQTQAAIADEQAEIAATQAAIADNSARIAQARADTLQSLSLTEAGEDAILENNFDLGIALLLEANSIPDSPLRARQVLFDNAPQGAKRLLLGHEQKTNAVATFEGLIASGSDDNTIKLWDIETGEVVRTLEGHTARVNDVAFLPSGLQLVSVSDDQTAILWDVETGEIVRVYQGHTDDVLAVATDGQVIVTGSRDETIIVWEIFTGRPIHTLQGTHTARITTVDLYSSLVVSGGADNQIVVWSCNTGDLLQVLDAHQDAIVDVAFSPDGQRMMSVSADNRIILWNVNGWQTVYARVLTTTQPTSLSISPDGTQVIIGDGTPFAGDDAENVIVLWDLEQGSEIRRFFGHDFQVTDVAFANDGESMVSASASGVLRLWQVDAESYFWSSQIWPTDFTAVYVADDRIVAALSDRSLVLWNMNGVDDTPTYVRKFGLSEHREAITAVDVYGNRAVTSSLDRTLILWNLDTFEIIARMEGHTNQVHGVAFSPDGTRILSGSRDRTLILWDGETGELLRTFSADHTNSINAVAFSPDGTRALSASEDRSLILWDVESGDNLMRLRGHMSGVLDVVFSADGHTAYSGGQDQLVIGWDLETGVPLQQYMGHTDWVTSVDVSADGETMVSGSRDRTVLLWTTDILEPVHRFRAADENILRVALLNEDHVAGVASADGNVRVLPVSAEAYVDWIGSNRYVYELTCTDRALYPLDPCDTTTDQSE
ncbi:MAG: protein kinase [Chloroflexi bacterium]|nr:protein kinase [Chloroflexota bacterium]